MTATRSDGPGGSGAGDLDALVIRLAGDGTVVAADAAADRAFGDAVAAGEPFGACFEGDAVADAAAAVAGGAAEPRTVRAAVPATGATHTVTVTPPPAEAEETVAAVAVVVPGGTAPGDDLLRHREAVMRELLGVMADTDLDVEGRVRRLLALGRRELGTGYGALSRIEGESYVFEVVDAADDAVAAGDVVPLEATNCERTAATRRSVVLDDVARDAPELTDKAGYTDWGVACYLGAPVLVDGDVHGTLCFYDTAPRDDPFAPWQVTVVDLMARWLGTEMERGEAVARLERQNERLERFVAVASHDLRNPLNVVAGSLDAVADGDAEALARSHRATDRMTRLIEDLLALAKAGDEGVDAEPLGLGDAAREAAGNVALGDASVAVDVADTVRAEATRLGQLFENLYRNAVEHGSEGDEGAPLSIEVGALDDGFYVADDGRGIAEERRDDVFEAGYTTSDGGTGFGLAIVEEVAAAHGWTVAVDASEGGGARFEVRGVGGPSDDTTAS